MCDNPPPLLPKPPGLQYSLEKRFLAGSSRKISQRACDFCRRKKRKCDGGKPACHHCTQLGEKCLYEREDKRKTTVWQAEINALRRRNARLERILGKLKANNEAKALQTLNKIRSDGYGAGYEDVVSDAEPDDVMAPGESSHSTSDTLISSGRSSNMFQQQDLSSVTVDYIPHEFWTRRAVAAFFTCAATLFYVTTRDACEAMLDKIYQNRESVKKSDICEICAIAAIGSQYDTDEIPDDVKEIYFNLASVLLHDTVDEDKKKGMRAFICLSMFSVMSKSTSARLLIVSGLNLARWNIMSNSHSSDYDQADMIEWQRLLRTLAFLECWLSFSLGYTYGLTTEEMGMISCLPMSASYSVEVQMIQAQMSKIALISAQIYADLQSLDKLTWQDTTKFTDMLDSWYHELPASLHLAALLSPANPLSLAQTRSLMLVHVIYLGTRLHLHQHLLKLIELQDQRSGGVSTQIESSAACQVPQMVRYEYTGFAQQQARIITLLYQNKAVFTRCWLVIRAAYTSSVMLLLSICQTLVAGEVDDWSTDPPVIENLRHVSSCLEILQYCCSRDIAADRFLHSVTPIYEKVKQILCPEVQLPRFEDAAENSLSTRNMQLESTLDQRSPMDKVAKINAMIPHLLELSSAPGRTVWT